MFLPFLTGIAGVGVALLVLALCVITIVRAVAAPEEVRRGARCGGCGHEITELGPGRCPECGADLRRVGLTTPRMALRLRGSLPAAVLAWTILIAGCSGIGYGFVLSVMSFSPMAGASGRVQLQKQTVVEPIDWGFGEEDPRTAYSIDVSIDVIGARGGVPESGTMEYRFLVERRMERTLEVDAATGSYVVRTVDGGAEWSGDAFGVAESERLYETVGLDVTDEKVKEEARQFADLVELARQSPSSFDSAFGMQGFGDDDVGLVSSGGSTSTWPAPSPGVGGMSGEAVAGIVVLTSAIVLYVAGLVLMIWRRRVLMAV